MTAVLRMKLVSLWCAGCVDYVTFEGPVYEDRVDAPVHITPQILQAHREKVGHP